MFSSYKLRIMTTSNDFTSAIKVQAGVLKKLAFSLVHVIKIIT